WQRKGRVSRAYWHTLSALRSMSSSIGLNCFGPDESTFLAIEIIGRSVKELDALLAKFERLSQLNMSARFPEFQYGDLWLRDAAGRSFQSPRLHPEILPRLYPQSRPGAAELCDKNAHNYTRCDNSLLFSLHADFDAPPGL